ncbi:MAG: PIN domain-containing protein [Sulfurimonas sp.]|nr:PIN domain-containing protein [Sulfurimonas sp.]
MHKKVFIDANVILDLFECSRLFHEYSTDVIGKLILDEEVELFISTDMISNIFYILNNIYKYGFDKTLNVIEKISQIFNLHGVVQSDIRASIDICKKHIFKDYEDALQYICALDDECTLIVTNNPKDFKNSSIDIATSKELSEMWKHL